ncbi:MAG: antitoxin [Acidimicrobiaceae bacterium]|nr:antitoxin [Acidimicrobiaceae bacterium]
MYRAKLRKVGGSVMLALPPVLLDLLELRSGASVDIDIDDGRLIVVPRPRPRYLLDELLAQCDETAIDGEADREWIEGMPLGAELL